MNQAAIAAVLSLALGFLLGAFYDVIRLFRAIFGVTVKNPFKKGRFNLKSLLGYIYVSAGDLLFFIVASAAMCVFFFLTGDGRARGYALFSSFCGFLLYYNTVGRLFICAVSYIVNMLKRAVRLISRPILHTLSQVKRIFDMPIVKAVITRYNNYITKRKKRAKARARAKAARRGGSFANSVCSSKKGGSHGQ